MDDASLAGGHGLELDAHAGRGGLLGRTTGRGFERGGSPSPIAGGIDDHARSILPLRPMADCVGQVLKSIDRLAVPANQDTEVVPDEGRHELLTGFVDPDRGSNARGGNGSLEKLPHDACLRVVRLAVSSSARRERVGEVGARDDGCGRIADTK